jgi:hypothetical protein
MLRTSELCHRLNLLGARLWVGSRTRPPPFIDWRPTRVPMVAEHYRGPECP